MARAESLRVNSYTVSQRAADDIFAIWSYLASRVTVELADRFEADLKSHFQSLAQVPGIGHRRSDLKNRSLLYFRAHPYQYMIAYRVGSSVEIVAVLHGRRNLNKLLSER